MSAVRLIFYSLLSIVAGAWALSAFSAQYVRFHYREMITTLMQSDSVVYEASALSGAIADYTRAMRFRPCDVLLHKNQTLLLTQAADLAMAEDYPEEIETYLDKSHRVLASLLSCTPRDGKAWLDYAILNTYREGFTKRSLEAYKMSARVTPGESWLAEKRLLFALQVRPLLDKEARMMAREDLVVLARAHPNHLKFIMEVSQMASPEAVRELFAP